jgi:hypothetical protein
MANEKEPLEYPVEIAAEKSMASLNEQVQNELFEPEEVLEE